MTKLRGGSNAVDPAVKKAAMFLLRRGLMSQAEVARMIGVSKMAVSLWCRGIDLEAARAAVVRRIWERATRVRS